MKKTGRPKSITKRENRFKTVALNELAFLNLEKIRKERPLFDFSRYVSECLINDFSGIEGIIRVKKLEIGELNKEIGVLQDKISRLVVEIRELQEEEIESSQIQ